MVFNQQGQLLAHPFSHGHSSCQKPWLLLTSLSTLSTTSPLPLPLQVINRRPWRHALQLLVCVSEIYGGAMTFFPEWLSRPTANPNLSSEPVHVWIYLAFMNGVWVVIPVILAITSFVKLTRAADVAKIERDDSSPPGKIWYTLSFWTLVLYAILVPAVVLTAGK